MKTIFRTLLVLLLLAAQTAGAKTREYRAADYGITPGTGEDLTPALVRLLGLMKAECGAGDRAVLRFGAGRYDFHAAEADTLTCYISNHDQNQPKRIGFVLEGWRGLTVEGDGADFVFHGRMIPMMLSRSAGCVLRNFSVDFDNPQIAQVEILSNDPDRGIVFRPAPWVRWRLAEGGLFESYGDGWSSRPWTGMAFEPDTKRIVYNTGDLSCPGRNLRDLGDGTLAAPEWRDRRLVPGTVVVLRTGHRPTPGLFLRECRDTRLENIRIHYAEGMGLLAQLCTDITLDGFGVCLRGDDDPRYFTTQADATHFSQCDGLIDVRGGLFEGMMDDAINVHGIYLKVLERRDDHTLVASYMHNQAWGFGWGHVGDKVQAIRSRTMETVGGELTIVSIRPEDTPSDEGATRFEIRFAEPVDASVTEAEGFGLENMTLTPRVRFRGNVVRNNRARGALFSTPRRTVVEENLFDHTSGTAILLCGDCNGWYETGACRDVVIRRNRFVNALTSMYQFTNAVISIYPEIPDLEHQQQYFHGGRRRAIRIEGNTFETFDAPILYAKSVDGLLFRDNRILLNTEYKPWHRIRQRVLLERVGRAEIDEE